jgi:hypothetical protein
VIVGVGAGVVSAYGLAGEKATSTICLMLVRRTNLATAAVVVRVLWELTMAMSLWRVQIGKVIPQFLVRSMNDVSRGELGSQSVDSGGVKFIFV